MTTDLARLAAMERELAEMTEAETDPAQKALNDAAYGAVARAAFGPVQAVRYVPPPDGLPFDPKEGK